MEPPITCRERTHKTVFDKDAFLVEGTALTVSKETAEPNDTCILISDQIGSERTSFVSSRRYDLCRKEHVAVDHYNSLYNLRQSTDKNYYQEVTVITCFPLDHYPHPNLTIAAEQNDNQICEESEPSWNRNLFDFTLNQSKNYDTFDVDKSKNDFDTSIETPRLKHYINSMWKFLKITNPKNKYWN